MVTKRVSCLFAVESLALVFFGAVMEALSSGVPIFESCVSCLGMWWVSDQRVESCADQYKFYNDECQDRNAGSARIPNL